MRIPGPEDWRKCQTELDDEIMKAIREERRSGRICGARCDMTCAACGSMACQCQCAPDCANAPRALSADPDRHPIEPAILPLVFALQQTEFFDPCWSCEGHLNPERNVWKAPRVWFYSREPLYVRLLNGGLRSLERARRLNAAWRIVVTHSDANNPEPTYSLEPALDAAAPIGLGLLQADAKTIADALSGILADEAQRLQRNVQP